MKVELGRSCGNSRQT